MTFFIYDMRFTIYAPLENFWTAAASGARRRFEKANRLGFATPKALSPLRSASAVQKRPFIFLRQFDFENTLYSITAAKRMPRVLTRSSLKPNSSITTS
jgi:hypothetical protein